MKTKIIYQIHWHVWNHMLFAFLTELYNFQKWSQEDHTWNHE